MPEENVAKPKRQRKPKSQQKKPVVREELNRKSRAYLLEKVYDIKTPLGRMSLVKDADGLTAAEKSVLFVLAVMCAGDGVGNDPELCYPTNKTVAGGSAQSVSLVKKVWNSLDNGTKKVPGGKHLIERKDEPRRTYTRVLWQKFFPMSYRWRAMIAMEAEGSAIPTPSAKPSKVDEAPEVVPVAPPAPPAPPPPVAAKSISQPAAPAKAASSSGESFVDQLIRLFPERPTYLRALVHHDGAEATLARFESDAEFRVAVEYALTAPDNWWGNACREKIYPHTFIANNRDKWMEAYQSRQTSAPTKPERRLAFGNSLTIEGMKRRTKEIEARQAAEAAAEVKRRTEEIEARKAAEAAALAVKTERRIPYGNPMSRGQLEAKASADTPAVKTERRHADGKTAEEDPETARRRQEQEDDEAMRDDVLAEMHAHQY